MAPGREWGEDSGANLRQPATSSRRPARSFEPAGRALKKSGLVLSEHCSICIIVTATYAGRLQAMDLACPESTWGLGCPRYCCRGVQG